MNKFDRNIIIDKLIRIWKEVLEIDKVDLDDSFLKLGGNSLKAVIIEAIIEKEFNVEIYLSSIFRNLTIIKLAKLIEHSEQSDYTPIHPAPALKNYPMSHAQKAVFAISQKQGESTNFNMPVIKVAEGKIDIPKIEKVFNRIIARHESLRTYFGLTDGELVQNIVDNIDFRVELYKLSAIDVDALINQLRKPFDLSKAPLFRVSLIQISDDKHILVMDMHHIISDGISMGILFREFCSLYEGKELPKLNVQYKDFAVWQSNLFDADYYKKMEDYWLNVFSGEIPILNMPVDFKDTNKRDYSGDGIEFVLSKEITQEVNRIASEIGVTAYIVIFAVFSLLLNKYSRQDDIIIGSISAGRRHADLNDIIGIFINILPIRVKFNSDNTFLEFLDYINDTVLGALKNQEYPIERIIENLDLLPNKNNYSANPLFNSMINFHNEAKLINNVSVGDLIISDYKKEEYLSQMDILLDIYPGSYGELHCTFEYNKNLFSRSTAERFVEQFINLYTAIIQTPAIRLAEINLLSEKERNKVIYTFNNTKQAYPYNTALHQMFEEQARSTPERKAVEFGNEWLTYRELNEKANQLARCLVEYGVSDNTVVGIMFERSLEMMIGIMAVLKSGGAYLPIDPTYPEERVKYLLDDSKVSILLTQEKLCEKIKIKHCKIISVDNIMNHISLSIENLNLPYSPERLMYVLYTSGSTGKPKGAMIRAHSFVNLMYWFIKEFGMDENDRNLLIAPISFDLAQKNLYATLLTGGCLCLYPSGMLDYEIMSEEIKKFEVTLINCTPSAFCPLIDFNIDSGFDRLKSLRKVFLGGEPINLTKLMPWVNSGNYNAEIINTYGPTECTDIASYYRIDNNIRSIKTIPIGKPIYNTRLYVLDTDMKILPLGVEGELYIGGVGVGQGYYNMPELTNERFVECVHLPETRVYKTGDLVRWLPDGNIEFIGRADHQVKIRGFRIELGEIESKLKQLKYVEEAVVVARDGGNRDKYLCAYLVSSHELIPQELREYLFNSLPDYMVPSHFLQLDKMPLSPNGKIDRKQLPDPENKITQLNEYDKPSNIIEERMLEIWKEMLKTESLSINDNFFNKGGHSLKAIMVIAKMNKVFETTIPIGELFKTPTIKELSYYISGIVNEKTEREINIEDIEFNF